MLNIDLWLPSGYGDTMVSEHARPGVLPTPFASSHVFHAGKMAIWSTHGLLNFSSKEEIEPLVVLILGHMDHLNVYL